MSSCVRFMCISLRQVSFLSSCSPRHLTYSFWGTCTLFIWTGGHVSVRVVKVTWTDLESLASILHFLTSCRFQFLVCSLCEATTGSFSVAGTAKFAVVVSGVIGRSAVYNRYNKWGADRNVATSKFYELRGSETFLSEFFRHIRHITFCFHCSDLMTMNIHHSRSCNFVPECAWN
jgi:hypothetical protein